MSVRGANRGLEVQRGFDEVPALHGEVSPAERPEKIRHFSARGCERQQPTHVRRRLEIVEIGLLDRKDCCQPCPYVQPTTMRSHHGNK